MVYGGDSKSQAPCRLDQRKRAKRTDYLLQCSCRRSHTRASNDFLLEIKTFHKVVTANMDSKNKKIIEKLLLDEATKISIEKLAKRKAHFEKLKANKKGNMKRRIVLGSSAAAQILNEDIDVLNKYKCETGESLKEPDNKSTKRFIKLNELTTPLPKPIHLSEEEFNRITNKFHNSLTLLDTLLDDNLETVLVDPNYHQYIREIIPDATDDFIENLCDYYFTSYNKKGKGSSFLTPKTANPLPRLKIIRKKVQQSGKVSRASSPILEEFEESSSHSSIKKVPKASLGGKPSDAEIIEIIHQFNLDENLVHLLYEIELLVEKFAENDNHLWRFRSINGQNYWVNRFNNSVKKEYPYLFTLKSEVRQILHQKGIISRKSSKNLIEGESREQISQKDKKESENDILSNSLENSKITNQKSYSKNTKKYSLVTMDGRELLPEKVEPKFVMDRHQIAAKLGLNGQENLVKYIDIQRDQIANMFCMNKSERSIKYNLDNIRRVIDRNLTDEQLMDILFYCPFRFPDLDAREQDYGIYTSNHDQFVKERSNSSQKPLRSDTNESASKASRFSFHRRNKSKLDTPLAKNILKDIHNSQSSLVSVSDSQESESQKKFIPQRRELLKPGEGIKIGLLQNIGQSRENIPNISNVSSKKRVNNYSSTTSVQQIEDLRSSNKNLLKIGKRSFKRQTTLLNPIKISQDFTKPTLQTNSTPNNPKSTPNRPKLAGKTIRTRLSSQGLEIHKTPQKRISNSTSDPTKKRSSLSSTKSRPLLLNPSSNKYKSTDPRLLPTFLNPKPLKNLKNSQPRRRTFAARKYSSTTFSLNKAAFGQTRRNSTSNISKPLRARNPQVQAEELEKLVVVSTKMEMLSKEGSVAGSVKNSQ
ncbi:unnamed protein product [Moneuplotes crassus]|uniref:Uncharacterized protein n=1 Tax=Euplotes crassus TaxID=5936 RepID=A0AAD2CYY4_EUPCR|nr:unnamed protein product [Moneuplotes crassus]